MNSINRRQILQWALGTSGLILLPRISRADTPGAPSSPKPFLLNIHFGSSCSMASGLVQPVTAGKWPMGYFVSGSLDGSNNPHLNTHHADGAMVFTSYLKFLSQISGDMCLLNGTPIALDHPKAKSLQTTGGVAPGMFPEWAMSLAQQLVGPDLKNPLILSPGKKAPSTPAIVTVDADTFNEFKEVTSDGTLMPKSGYQSIWDIANSRYRLKFSGPTDATPDLASAMDYQLRTLINGMPELTMLESDGTLAALQSQLSRASIANIVGDHPDKQEINNTYSQQITDSLVIAGILAKSGLGSGMRIDALSEDTHAGGADVVTARRATAVWAQIVALWKWLKEQGLDEAVTILVTQEFGRRQYNDRTMEFSVGGVSTPIKSLGRDHGFFMGMMAINKNVPSRGRVGMIDSNLTPKPSSNLAGSPANGNAYTSVELVGTLLMRLYPKYFATERIVRKFWPTFKEVPTLLR